MRFLKTAALFCIGGCSYVGVELLWRRRSHGSMFFLGGACVLVIGRLGRALERMSGVVRAVACGAAVTAMELATGLLVNRSYRVWDYRRRRWNFRGQICLLYSLYWIPLSAVAGLLYRQAEKLLLLPQNRRC